jgi:hypothetical protein
MPTIGEILQTKTSFRVGSDFDDHSLAKRMRDGGTESLGKPQGQGAMITKTSRSALGQSKRHTGRLKSQQIDRTQTWQCLCPRRFDLLVGSLWPS